MHKFYSIGLGKWNTPMIWLNETQNHLLQCQNDLVMYFVEKVYWGEALVNWLHWLSEPPAVCWSVVMGDLSHGSKGVYCTRPEAFKTEQPNCAEQGMSTAILCYGMCFIII